MNYFQELAQKREEEKLTPFQRAYQRYEKLINKTDSFHHNMALVLKELLNDISLSQEIKVTAFRTVIAHVKLELDNKKQMNYTPFLVVFDGAPWMYRIVNNLPL